MEVKLGRNIFVQNQPLQKRSNISSPNLAPLKSDTVSFKGSENVLKKIDFEGIDFAVVEKYKAPIEKFKTKDDFQKWCSSEIKSKIINKDFSGRQDETKIQRKEMLKEWFNYVLRENDGYNNATKLLILDSITKELKPNNDNLPPVLNRGVLADCIQEIEDNLKSNRKYSFNLNKMYQNKLSAYYLEDTDTGETETKWVKISSKKHDPENFEANVDKLKALSHKSWCTKSYNAKPYLSKGDFHVYLVKGQPKVGIRLVGNKIREIQGEKNNSYIPMDYFDEILDYLDKNKLNLHRDARLQIKDAKKLKIEIDKIKKDLDAAIKDNDIPEILKYFGIESIKDDDGFLIISEYKQPAENISFEDLGINENNLFKKIKQIQGTAVLTSPNLTSTGALESVCGDLYLNSRTNINIKCPNLKAVKGRIVGSYEQQKELIKRLSFYNNVDIETDRENLIKFVKSVDYDVEKIFSGLGIDVEKDEDGFLTISVYKHPSEYITFKEIGVDENKLFEKVKKIKGNANFINSSLKSLHGLESIGGNLLLGSEIEDLGNLKSVGGNFQGECGKIKTLGQLKKVDGYLSLRHSDIESLGDLEYVGGDVFLDSSEKLKSLGKLKHVEKGISLDNSNVSDLGDLEYVGEDAWFTGTKIKDVSKLKFVGEYIYYKDTPLKSRDFLHIKRNHNPLFYIWDKFWYCSPEN